MVTGATEVEKKFNFLDLKTFERITPPCPPGLRRTSPDGEYPFLLLSGLSSKQRVTPPRNTTPTDFAQRFETFDTLHPVVLEADNDDNSDKLMV